MVHCNWKIRYLITFEDFRRENSLLPSLDNYLKECWDSLKINFK